MSAAHLEKLNGEQRRAVEHGVGRADGAIGGPLLIIAGAGSGKTNTLAHRVAHLIVNGADPRRILLMTFSRRAAAEMTRRVERICAQALGGKAGALTDALALGRHLSWHRRAAAARYAEQIGLDPAFTIHDREDSADLMNLVRHDLGFSKTESRFPTKGTCLAIYSRAVNAELPLEEVLGELLSVVRRLERANCASCSRPMSRPSSAQNVLDYDDLLLYWAQMISDPRARRRYRRPLRPCAGRRISGHQPAAVLDPAGAEARRPRPHRRRRRRAVDLFVPRRDRAQHPRFSRPVQPAGARSSRSTAITARPSRSSPPPTA